MNKLIEKIVKVPLGTKLAIALGAMLAVTAASWALIIRELDSKIDANRGTIVKLEKDLVDKKVIADNLNQYKRDKELLERRLAEALTELPAAKDLDELLRQLNDVGRKSGLDIVNLEPQAETLRGFYASIPVKMTVTGTYHEIAVFFESIAKLRRIVNVSNLAFSSPQKKTQKVMLSASYLATTFRFVDASEMAAVEATAKKKKK